jgi:hypothetical protein
MKIVNWNIEWMNNWFVGYGQVEFRQNHLSSGINNVADLCRRVASVIKALNPDVLTLEEGPSDIREMALFTGTYLVDDHNDEIFDVFGGLDGGAQKVYALVKKDGEFKNPALASDAETLKLQQPWTADVSGNCELDGYEFTRLPLVLEGNIGDGEEKLMIVTLHTKSKYVHNGEADWISTEPGRKAAFIKAAVKNRRRISAEGMRLRTYLNELIKQDPNTRIIVTGDLNDGPGVDFFEKNYLTHNVTDIILGSTFYPNLLFKHAFLETTPDAERYTAIFRDFIDDIPQRKVLLDHFLCSPALSPQVQNAGIAHQEWTAETDDNVEEGRQKYVSDHRPIFINL